MKDKTGPTEQNPCGVNKVWGKGQTPIAEILQLIQREKWPIFCDIELEYDIPNGSDPVKEITKCVDFSHRALLPEKKK